jgi:hypothetical protein
MMSPPVEQELNLRDWEREGVACARPLRKKDNYGDPAPL